ncbi:hypothetical protein pEaSNUABM40_00337 [Erwinia phage pEa_SNUABM_40]|uniref:Uncharacterized protein n=1 Tax=Erwinia phage pEa_SNUABM_3 TaxID=2869552 RepID=A0AAE8BZ11_9CAUD|nr:hypothetical protein MPK68_gp335 [Erwinia phage pEa_SNUABM_3]QZE56869.1 hypothetical protein pEaSNUABM20_00333 [Erwinia phage pEa_SNUABM_20]QZE58553.1 hypothetical protein pEaSNUABM40_00337 [Erwinia phage pEa_SNUABM_40]UAW53114.1 hypothetical protein pEaSNUABM23_00332 [Erwinia phage pEa_SNUABM_23]UIW11009.1 hypothetical protein pEaSNUABM23_00332 [Erwinia phage pEa_SNUABM_31]QZE56532.1 hypothetical protein pEaSNUABM3_00335 [Erwinia phage pEa_SNUABM_3]
MKNPVNNLKAGLETVNGTLAALRSGSNLKRQHVVESLGQPKNILADLTKSLKSNTYKSYPDVLQLRDSVRATCTTCLSLSEQVAAKRIKPRELMEKLGEIVKSFKADIALANACLEYLPASRKAVSLDDMPADVEGKARLQAAQAIDKEMYEQEVNDKAVRREQREDAATAKTSRVLSRLKDAHAHKVPRTFNKAIQIIQLPVMARFGTLSMSPEALSRMGFKIETAGLHSTPSSDLGIIFEGQLLLFFRMSDAKGMAEEAAKDHKNLDGTLVERKRLQKERNAERRDLKKLNQLLEQAKSLKARRAIREQIEDAQTNINDATAKLEAMDARVRLAGSRERVYRQMKTSNDHAMLDYLNPIVDMLNEKSSSSLGLFTTMPLRGVMKDADVYCAWLMEKSAINLLLRHTGGDMKLQNWFLPWTNG